ncbi:hypothetical protein GGQ88_000078 [Novosphingobium hassiacum]|uniref:DUF4169 family protein n=1 Tax=Novosphingobium hassiacum TaxID=173676 RepID=A0A7W5ZTK0_9SPHN|nr:DUF4169 family protein [Novosphingobium hassiacum]MBB3858838.1 hypothetical protein [Novosphingobium hassiacum]
MGEVVSLGKARKAKAREDRETQAQANRAKFGRTKAEKMRDKSDGDRAARLLDGARRDEP